VPANSSVRVANMALQILGAKPIVSFTEGTKFATMIDSIYDTERDATLRAYPWNFAAKRVALARLDAVPVFGYANQFQLPADVLRVLEVFPEMDFKIEGRTLLCDSTAASIGYTARIESPVTWDANFASAFAAKLAMKIAYSATELLGMLDRARAAYADALGEARTVDAQEGAVQSALGTGANILVDIRLTNSRVDERVPFAGDFGLLGS